MCAFLRNASDFAEATISGLHQKLESGQHSARSLTELYLARVEAFDRNGPKINSVIELNPDALAIADELDREYTKAGTRGPLHGIPVLVKENIDTADRMKTTAGSLALLDSNPEEDAFIIRRLRMAGAVILGKANLSEWANFRSTHSISGWSGRGGQTRNPYVLDRNPCGSSSGSAAAVAANLCPLAIGTETDGSIVCPSSINGIVGIKPTVGLLSRTGIVPIAHSQDTPGPMASNVHDAAILLGILAGPDPRDPATKECDGKKPTDYARFLDARGLSGARLGIARKFFGVNAGIDRIMEHCIAEMRRCGAEIIDPADLPTHGQFRDLETEVLLYEFKTDLNAYLSTRRNSPVRKLADIIAFNEAHRIEEMPYFEQERMVEAERKGPLTEKAYLDALGKSQQLAREDGIDAVIKREHVDAIVAPTTGLAWITDYVRGDPASGSCSAPAAIAGYPHITVPAGFVHGLPVGISFFGPAWSEATLIKLAYGFEQAAKARQPPKFQPTLKLS